MQTLPYYEGMGVQKTTLVRKYKSTYNVLQTGCFLFLFISLFTVFFVFVPTLAQESNLLANSGFEQGLTGWAVNRSAQPYTTIDQTVKHTDTSSLKFTAQATGFAHTVHSGYIEVSADTYYQLSSWVRNQTGEETVSIGWQEFDANFTSIRVLSFVANSRKISPTWTEMVGVGKPLNAQTKYVKIRLASSYAGQGAIWFDTITFAARPPEWLPPYGCTNTDRSRCLDFGASTESPTGITYTAAAVSAPLTESQITYREVLGEKTLTVSIPQFLAGANGLPESSMILEIRYKDTIDDGGDANNTYRANHKAIVYSVINYQNPDPLFENRSDKNRYDIIGIGGDNDGTWKIKQYLFDKTQFQLLRSIGGIYTIEIKMPMILATDSTLRLPIDYISLQAVSETESKDFQKKTRLLYGFREVTPPADQPSQPAAYDSVLNLFVRDPMKPVYPHTKPAPNEIDKSIVMKSALGETEAASLGLYSQNGASGLTFMVDDLKNIATTSVIPRTNVRLFQVIHDYRRLVANPETTLTNGYGYIPDRIEALPSQVNIAPQTATRLWIKIDLPQQGVAGTYRSTLRIQHNGATIKTVPLELQVLPIQLDRSATIQGVAYDPYMEVFGSNQEEVLRLYREVGFDPIIYVTDMKIRKDAAGTIVFDTQLFENRLKKLKEERVVGTRAFFQTIVHWKKIHRLAFPTADPRYLYDQLGSVAFTEPYTRLIRAVADIARRYDTEFVFIAGDEPGDFPEERIAAHQIYGLLKSLGYKTALTYNLKTDTSLTIDPNVFILPSQMNQTLPSLYDRTDYKFWSPRYMDDGFDKQYAGQYGYYTTGYSFLRNPIYNRFAHGLLPFATDAAAVFAYSMGDLVNDPFNDFDANPIFRFPATQPDFLLAYPSWSGAFIPGMNIEGLREGIKDAKYIATLQRLIRERPQSSTAQQAQQYLAQLKQRIEPHFLNQYLLKGNAFGFTEPILRRVSDTASPTDYESFTRIRMQLIEYIAQLTSEAQPSPTSAPTLTHSPCSKKSQGDADCNGVTDTIDFEIWRKEFFVGCAQNNISICAPDADSDGNGMDANFNYTGSGYPYTDQKVDLTDFEIWRKEKFL